MLFGSPGSGKGTQARLLSDCLQVPQISTGDLLRQKVREGDSIGRAIAEIMHSGALVSDEVVTRLLEDRLSQADSARGFILDGYPRTRVQAETLCQELNAMGFEELVIHLLVDYNEIIARLTGRRQCPRCGTLYNVTTHPPKVAGVCDLDGAELTIRDDDREPVIRERLEAYERQTRPLIQYFRESGRPLLEVKASHETPQVLVERICGLIREQQSRA